MRILRLSLTDFRNHAELRLDPGPGLVMDHDALAWCAANIAGLEFDNCGAAGHHAPEDQPDAIAAAIAGWLDRHGLRAAR